MKGGGVQLADAVLGKKNLMRTIENLNHCKLYFD